MQGDDNDRTIIGPPPGLGGGDRTVIVPTPGRQQAGRSAPAPAAAAPRADARASAQQPSQALSTQIKQSLNPLVANASEILALHAELRLTAQHANPAGLRNQLVDKIRSFEKNLKSANYANEIIVSARYVICTSLDEAVLNTPWGVQSGWAQHSLLSTFHNETFGGEKFFLIMGRLLESPAKYVEALELIYLILAGGFAGKYKLDPRGHLQLEEIKDNLYRTILLHRGDFERDLSPRWQGLPPQSKNIAEYVPMWVIASLFLFVMLLCYTGFRIWLDHTTSPVAEQLNTLITTEQNLSGE
jgi:type VI secretion system protein ImpK